MDFLQKNIGLHSVGSDCGGVLSGKDIPLTDFENVRKA